MWRISEAQRDDAHATLRFSAGGLRGHEVKILQINKFLWLSGGVERYMFDLADLMESKGHDICYFSMQDVARNRPSRQSPYFVSNIDYKKMSFLGAARRASSIVSKTVYSFESKAKIRRLLRDLKPDLAHLHSIDHQISPSILHVLREEGVPVVQSVHDYKLICPNYQLYVPQRGELCERCLPGKYHHCLRQRCMKNSLAASALVTGAMYLHKRLRIYENNVWSFLCSTQFLLSQLKKGGFFNADTLRHVPLYINLDRYQARDMPEDYAVYVGRVVIEKGLKTLVRAAAKAPRCKLVVVGEGPARAELESLAEECGADGVSFVGRQSGDALTRLIARARFLVLPSELYETCGLVLWEAYALGRPVIASRIGGIPESIDEGETGLMFEPGNVSELAEKIAWLFDHPKEAEEMGAAGRKKIEAICASHYDRMLAVYEEAIEAIGTQPAGRVQTTTGL
ncbi:MAG: glycosyltransferase family 4 protein [Candidatus Hydrogenedentes bacterium]|nr:glycosyltransferase family 4 protein [Candidatus Hydrogenedentota bacterium]